MQRSLWLPFPNPSTYQSSMVPIQTQSQYSIGWQDTMAFFIATFTIYLFSTSILYGFYGDARLILGPSSSRLIQSRSFFVDQIEVTNEYTNANNDIHLYAFNEKPELNSEINWTTSKFLVVEAYSRKGISLWLNEGSTICLRWEAEASSLNKLEGIVIKGEKRFEKLEPNNGKRAEYIVEEDDRYQIGILNMNARNIILTLHINVSAKIYDTTKATNKCSTRNGSCKLDLFFPITYYLVLTAPKNGNDDDDAWFVEISFMARVFSYIILLGVFMIVIFMILKCLGADYGEIHNVAEAQEVTETEPLMQPNPVTYGTNIFHEKEETNSDVSEELYDEKLCIICFDEQRNCFFVPCGHCATCYDCAQRIMDEESNSTLTDQIANPKSKVCPVCRRVINKVKRLF
ncbi:ubiquitin-protein ligase, putative [Medicago truncatula]|uniref:Ubiquitin-protein ligase, putative n=1 Tax=Medicago truncatula TaxID=3880 RepID=G7I297_MEDTR|nr:ubiquitin-protein ligase, putative [Medicago truncatula]